MNIKLLLQVAGTVDNGDSQTAMSIPTKNANGEYTLTGGATTANDEYDISDLAFNISWETTIIDQPGKLTFTCVEDGVVQFNKGSVIRYYVDNVPKFYGYVFTSNLGDSDMIEVVCYDQTRYLQNKDIQIIEGKTASQVFAMVCQNFEIKNNKIISPTTNIIPSRIHDDKSLYEIIDWGISWELINNQKWYIVRDNFGTLEFVDIKTLETEKCFSDYTNILKYNYESSIDSDTYNRVKIVQENRVSKKGKAVKSGGTLVSRDYGYLEDPVTKNLWGILQYVEKSDKQLNQAQLDTYAKSVLSQKNRETKTFKITAIGDIDVQAGNCVFIQIDKLKKVFPEYRKFLITSCQHNFENNCHTMDLTLMPPQYGYAWR